MLGAIEIKSGCELQSGILRPASCEVGKLLAVCETQLVGPVAQRLEQQTHNLLVAGSNPAGPTKTKSPDPICKYLPKFSHKFLNFCSAAVSAVSYPADGILNRLRSGRRDGTLAAKFLGAAVSNQQSAPSVFVPPRQPFWNAWQTGHSASPQIQTRAAESM